MQPSADHDHQARQQTLYRYMDAFRRGDFETMSHIFAQAEQDSTLEDLLWNVLRAVATEHVSDEQRAQDTQQVRDLLRRLKLRHEEGLL
jgi:hypothetical protein